MSNMGTKLLAIALIIALSAAALECYLPLTKATSTNALQNPGFETGASWGTRYSTLAGTYAQVQNSTYMHSGNYSGLTRTTTPKQEVCSASLYQTLNVSVRSLDSFYYWIRKGSSAQNGYYEGQATLYLSGGYILTYYHGFDGSNPPADSSTHKYINAGNPTQNTWTQVSRNLLNDLTNKFGFSILNKTVAEIDLTSCGSKDLETYYCYGQNVNWDDTYMESQDPAYCITLTSSTKEGGTNVGTITFADINYQLPNTTLKMTGSYVVTANAPANLTFYQWETTGGISVNCSYQKTALATVTSDGTLKAVFGGNRSWTFMVYMCGDNNLDDEAFLDLNEMEEVGSTLDVAIVVQLDRNNSSPSPSTKRYYVTQDADANAINSYLLDDLGEQNMGLPSTLQNFTIWAIEHYQADHYALIFWDHGGGFRGACEDDNSSKDILRLPEIEMALDSVKTNTGVTIDLVGFMACFMGQLEPAYQLRELAQVYVGSADIIPTPGTLPWTAILGNLTGTPTMKTEELGAQIVTSYGEYLPMAGTMSAVNISEICAVAEAMDALGTWLDSNDALYHNNITWVRNNVLEYNARQSWFIDAYDFANLTCETIENQECRLLCQEAMDCIGSAVFSEYHTPLRADSHGLSTYFPGPKPASWTLSDWREFYDWNEDIYLQIDFANYSWDEFWNNYWIEEGMFG